MKFKTVDPAEFQLNKAVSLNKEKGRVTLETGTFLVVDPAKLAQLGVQLEQASVVGTIEYPLGFCPRDHSTAGTSEQACEGGFSFFATQGSPRLWLHTDCYRPTKKWYNETFQDLVQVKPEIILPWGAVARGKS